MKKFIALSLTIFMLFTFCACGGPKIKTLEDIEGGISYQATKGLIKVHFEDGTLTVEEYTVRDFADSPSGKIQFVDKSYTKEYSLVEDNKIEVEGTTYTYTIDVEDGEVSFNMSFLDMTRYFEFTV